MINGRAMRSNSSTGMGLKLRTEEFERCLRDFQEVARRRLMVWHHFLDDLMLSTVQTLILDFFDFHARINGAGEEIQSQSALTMSRFIGMLERGEYRKNIAVSVLWTFPSCSTSLHRPTSAATSSDTSDLLLLNIEDKKTPRPGYSPTTAAP